MQVPRRHGARSRERASPLRCRSIEQKRSASLISVAAARPLPDDRGASEGGVDLQRALCRLEEGYADDGVSDDELDGPSPLHSPSVRSPQDKFEPMTLVHTFCVCEEFDKVRLPALLEQHIPAARPVRWSRGQETIYIAMRPDTVLNVGGGAARPERRRPGGREAGPREPLLPGKDPEPPAQPGGLDDKCLVFFSYGAVVMWGSFSQEDHADVRRLVDLCGIRALSKGFMESDDHSVRYCDSLKAHIQDDVISLPHRLCSLATTRLAVAHALAQSARLGVFEGQGKALVSETLHMPRELARDGQISLSRGELSKMIGRLYTHKSQVNLMTNVLDMPEYFWYAQDWVQELYKALANYLEVPERVEAVNARLEVVQDMLDMTQSRSDARRGERLEWIIIVLVALEAAIGLLEFFGIIGLFQ